MAVWIPGAIFGVIVNVQVHHLGKQLPDVAGGTPSYLTRLLNLSPQITTYAAIGYFLSWVAVLPVNAIILTDLVQTCLAPLGITVPSLIVKVGFTLLAFVVAFSGSQALSTLHLTFLIPAVGLLLTFCLQGSVHFFSSGPLFTIWAPFVDAEFSLQGWAKWYLVGTYAFYACETASVFVADSKRPNGTLKSLFITAGLIPVVYIVGSWLLINLPANAIDADDTFSLLKITAFPFWGNATSLLTTFLVSSSCLLSLATAVSIAPRVLYQLAQDQQLSAIFGNVSSQGVFAPGLGLTLVLSLSYLIWGDIHQIVMVTGVGWLVSFIVLHWGLWTKRGTPGVVMPWVALGMAVIEVIVLCIGGWAWGLPDLVIGLLLPVGIMVGDRLIQQIQQFANAQPTGIRFFSTPKIASSPSFENFVSLQVAILVALTAIATVVSWLLGAALTQVAPGQSLNSLVILVLVLSFISVAIACWTILPQVIAVNRARQSAEALSQELQTTLEQLQKAQVQMIQNEKLSSLGQLVAGVAHEINNPVNFIHGNVLHARQYIDDLLTLIEKYRKYYPDPVDEIQKNIHEIDLDFLEDDLPKILNSMTLGTDRIREIVLSLRNFSRQDEAACKAVNIHEGIESTLLILQHRLKATPDHPDIQVIRNYGNLPLVECFASQLNQVFMNIVANAIDAMEDASAGQSYDDLLAHPNILTIQTQTLENGWVQIEISDNGPGIPESIQSKIFDPFFTTKPVGKGTGMGMSISYQIITEGHQGHLICTTELDRGTTFKIQIPQQQTNPNYPDSRKIDQNYSDPSKALVS
jgi:signal transduction histidine kinase